MLMKYLASLVFAAMVLLPSYAGAEDQNAFEPPSGFSIQAKTFPPPPGESAEYGASESAPNWKIAQWGVPKAKLALLP